MTGKVVVVGSLSMDLVVQTVRRPEKGETIIGTGFGMFAGGKGNNQAIASARALAHVSMIGRVGNDGFGETLLETLKRENVDISGMTKDSNAATGIAHITVDSQGENYIVIAQQANANLSAADVENSRHLIEECDVLLMQLEVPFEPLCAAAALARKKGAIVVLNPAPAPAGKSLPLELLNNVDIIIPNQPEAFQLSGIDASTVDGAQKAAAFFESQGISTSIVTLGEAGALVWHEGSSHHIKSFKVKSIDSTAAGDAFCGAFAASLARGEQLLSAVRTGCAAGALATTRLGAEPSLPYQVDIEKLLEPVTST
jgi:ribokinase